MRPLRRQPRWLVGLAGLGLAVAAIACAGDAGEASPSGASTAAATGDARPRAPDFTLTTLDGDQLSRADLLGRPYILFFHATW